MNTAKEIRMFAAVRAAAATMIAVVSVTAFAGDKPMDIGKGEYDAACAVCHGFSGKGNGPVAAKLANRMPDLTVLAKNNKDVFPFDRVYQIIDGRIETGTHGPREMPIWGTAFRRQSSVFFENYPAHDIESGARSRMLALTEYLYRLQGK